VKVIRVDPKERKIGLSRRQLIEAAKAAAGEKTPAKERRGKEKRAKAAQPLKGGVGDGSGPLIDLAGAQAQQKQPTKQQADAAEQGQPQKQE